MSTVEKKVPENIVLIVHELNINACNRTEYEVRPYLYKEARNNIGDRHDDWRLSIFSKKTNRTVVENLAWEHAHWHTYAVMLSGFDREIEKRDVEAAFETIRGFTSTLVESIGQRPRIYEQFIVDKYPKQKEE